jgi:hypothetical protein
MSDAPKSAYDLAMERLRKKDAEQGVVTTPLTDTQREQIAEIRRTFAARIAQEEILQSSRRQGVQSPDELSTLEQEYRRDIARLNDERERQIQRVRGS